MDQFVVRTSDTAKSNEIKQAEVKLKTVQLNCGYIIGIGKSHNNSRCVELRNLTQRGVGRCLLVFCVCVCVSVCGVGQLLRSSCFSSVSC